MLFQCRIRTRMSDIETQSVCASYKDSNIILTLKGLIKLFFLVTKLKMKQKESRKKKTEKLKLLRRKLPLHRSLT